ncbi:MAG TPA: hypothetical protein VN428_18560 [Bryobacteraceae bacterium]|nr:hypothetical protein [Bryobacteraceae bacterium]
MPLETGWNLRSTMLSNNAARALSVRRASLRSLEETARVRLARGARYEPDLRDIVDRLNALRDDVGDIVHEKQFDQQVPMAQEVRNGPCQACAELTLASILRATHALADYIDLVLQSHKAPRREQAHGQSKSAAA